MSVGDLYKMDGSLPPRSGVPFENSAFPARHATCITHLRFVHRAGKVATEMRRTTSLTLAAVLLSPAIAHASLIEGLCDHTLDPTVTCDTETGLEWLDLTETVGLSANDFLANAGGWLTAGWSMATGAQVEVLLRHAGADLTGATPSNDPSVVAAASLLIDLLGDTSFGRLPGTSHGVGFALENATEVSVPEYVINNSFAVIAGREPNDWQDYDAQLGIVGIWAYRAGSVPVPEPNTLVLLGSALAGLRLVRRKRAA